MFRGYLFVLVYVFGWAGGSQVCLFRHQFGLQGRHVSDDNICRDLALRNKQFAVERTALCRDRSVLSAEVLELLGALPGQLGLGHLVDRLQCV